MMKYMLAGMALVFASAPTLAGTPWVDQREHRQAHRIYNGIQSGSLSFNEARKLIRGQVRVRAMERQFKSDGVVTPWERARLHQALDRKQVFQRTCLPLPPRNRASREVSHPFADQQGFLAQPVH